VSPAFERLRAGMGGVDVVDKSMGMVKVFFGGYYS